jgi:metallo-beta-lactamase family protein
VVIVGFQAMGTPGRALVDGAKVFHIGGDEIMVKASIHTLGGFSAHASQSQLLEWISHFKKPWPKLYLVHGEENAKLVLKEKLSEKGWSPTIPHYGDSISF